MNERMNCVKNIACPAKCLHERLSGGWSHVTSLLLTVASRPSQTFRSLLLFTGFPIKHGGNPTIFHPCNKGRVLHGCVT